jgi:hypothetical protein
LAQALPGDGSAGKAKAVVKGKGVHLPDDLCAYRRRGVQLVNETPALLRSGVDSANVIKNDGGQFRATK